MPFDLKLLSDRAPAAIAMQREHAIYLDAQRSDRKIHRARNVAELLERGHRSRPGANTAMLVDLKT